MWTSCRIVVVMVFMALYIYELVRGYAIIEELICKKAYVHFSSKFR